MMNAECGMEVLDKAAREARRWPAWIRNSDRPQGRRKPLKFKGTV